MQLNLKQQSEHYDSAIPALPPGEIPTVHVRCNLASRIDASTKARLVGPLRVRPPLSLPACDPPRVFFSPSRVSAAHCL